MTIEGPTAAGSALDSGVASTGPELRHDPKPDAARRNCVRYGLVLDPE
ncbi:hypothetical protein ACWFOS_04030 [Gordonia terrae]